MRRRPHVFTREDGVPVHCGGDRFRVAPHYRNVLHGDRGEPLVLLRGTIVEVPTRLEVLGKGQPHTPGAVLPEVAPATGEIGVTPGGHINKGMRMLMMGGVVSRVQPACRASLMVHVENFPLGRERFLPAVWEWSVEVSSGSVLIGGHSVMVGKMGGRGRRAGGKLGHHGLLLVHRDLH